MKEILKCLEELVSILRSFELKDSEIVEFIKKGAKNELKEKDFLFLKKEGKK